MSIEASKILTLSIAYNKKGAYQIITAEGIAKRKNSAIPWNISMESGERVIEQAGENFM